MPTHIPVSNGTRHTGAQNVPKPLLTALSGIGLAVFAAAAWNLPAPLILPAISVVAIATAACVAAVACTKPPDRFSQRVTYWDVAGALTFIGISAALLSDPEHVLPLLEVRRPA